jgi:type II secretory pathway pseudopilin PulG
VSSGFQLRNYKITQPQNRSRGYILISLMLFLALLAVAALAALPNIALQVKRDREEEMIHRGVAYSRAVRRYFKKYNRYPTRIEDLENANNLRFIRKRYKDPINDQDFTILRYGDPRLLGVMLGPMAGLAGARPVQPPPPGSNPSPPASNAPPPSNATTDSSNPPGGQTNPTPGSSSSSSGDSSSSTSQPFGGGPMVGVVSASSVESIREFNGKNHYNDWLFIYVPMTDRGGLLNAPYQPNLNPIIPALGPRPGMPTPGQPPQPQNPPNPGQMPPMQ